jgi:hypothetical protein
MVWWWPWWTLAGVWVADAGVAVVVVVVVEELVDEVAGVGEAGEAFGEERCVLQRLEL